ncbi:MAG: hypothetical protein M3P04_07220 [Actinomycetota bacterium]|nr:hypothetical protein [Actinomycetota bacterium]
MPDLDQLLHSEISLAAAQAVETCDFAIIERRAAQRRRTRTVLALSAAAVATVLTVVASLQVASSPRSAPTIPIQQPTPTPTAGWTGPLRPDLSLPKVPGSLPTGWIVWPDASRDANVAAVDIVKVAVGGSRRLAWTLSLRGPAEKSTTRWVEYGVIVDQDGDRVADCEIGLVERGTGSRDFLVRVKNLKTGAAGVQDGGPYGNPIDFAAPSEAGSDGSMRFFFLQDPVAGTCGRLNRSALFYTWAMVSEGGTPISWDFAPDKAWLRMPAKEVR